MLTLELSGEEFFNEETQEFAYPEPITLELEHSLVALSKWESIHEKPFLGPDEKSSEEMLSYIRCMILTKDIPENLFSLFTDADFEKIQKYLDLKMTATWFSETQTEKKAMNRETITSELIYFWMTSFNIPFESENWHLTRLFTLIKIANIKNQPPKKMSPEEARAKQRELNARRRAQTGTTG